jgi:hypothetical protein
MSIYEPGENIPIHTDLMPASIAPLPPGVPGGKMLRVLVTERALTVMWQTPEGSVGRMDLPMSAEQTSQATYSGGQVGEYQVARAGGCGCRGKALKAAAPFPGHRLTQAPRLDQARQTYGVPPKRFERVRREVAAPIG